MERVMKEVKDGYKMTELGGIPVEWEVKKIGELFEFKNGLNKEKSFFGKGTKIVNYTDVFNKRGLTNEDVKGLVTVSEGEIERFNCKKGDVFFTRTSETIEEIGMTTVLLEDIQNVVFSGFVLRARPITSDLSLYYKKYCFSDFNVRKEIMRKSSYTTRALTSGTLLKDVYITIPPLKEQQKIADILSTVDTQIDQTEKLIQKTKELKKGLMQKLLTKGIGHTEFKKTELGEIPVEWEVQSNFIKIKSGFGFKLKEYSQCGIPLIRINNVTHGKISNEDLCYLPKNYLESYKEFVLNKGDILLALNRPITRDRLKIAIVEEAPAILYQRVGKLEMDSEKYDSKFYYQYLQSNKFLEKLKTTLVGTDQPYIKTTQFAEIKFPVPNISEQKQIINILSSVDENIQQYEHKKEKLQELKNGLMQQLLTGKVRTV